MLDKVDFPDQKGRLIPDIFLSSIQSGRDALRLRIGVRIFYYLPGDSGSA